MGILNYLLVNNIPISNIILYQLLFISVFHILFDIKYFIIQISIICKYIIYVNTQFNDIITLN